LLFYYGFYFRSVTRRLEIREGWDDFQLWLCKRKVVEGWAQAKLEISIEREMSMTGFHAEPTRPCVPKSVTSGHWAESRVIIRYKKIQSFLETQACPQRVYNLSLLSGHYPVSYQYCAFLQLHALDTLTHVEARRRRTRTHCQRCCRSTYAGGDLRDDRGQGLLITSLQTARWWRFRSAGRVISVILRLVGEYGERVEAILENGQLGLEVTTEYPSGVQTRVESWTKSGARLLAGMVMSINCLPCYL
jgi:hypothetical protein